MRGEQTASWHIWLLAGCASVALHAGVLGAFAAFDPGPSERPVEATVGLVDFSFESALSRVAPETALVSSNRSDAAKAVAPQKALSAGTAQSVAPAAQHAALAAAANDAAAAEVVAPQTGPQRAERPPEAVRPAAATAIRAENVRAEEAVAPAVAERIAASGPAPETAGPAVPQAQSGSEVPVESRISATAPETAAAPAATAVVAVAETATAEPDRPPVPAAQAGIVLESVAAPVRPPTGDTAAAGRAADDSQRLTAVAPAAAPAGNLDRQQIAGRAGPPAERVSNTARPAQSVAAAAGSRVSPSAMTAAPGQPERIGAAEKSAATASRPRVAAAAPAGEPARPQRLAAVDKAHPNVEAAAPRVTSEPQVPPTTAADRPQRLAAIDKVQPNLEPETPQAPLQPPFDPVAALRAFDPGTCMLILPKVASTGAADFAAYGAAPDGVRRFKAYASRDREIDLAIEMNRLAETQCQAAEFVRQLPEYPQFAMRIDLATPVVEEGSLVQGEIRNIVKKVINLILIDDEGEVHVVNDYLSVSGGKVLISAPVYLTGPAVATNQMFIAIASGAPLDTLKDQSSRPAGEFFRALTYEAVVRSVELDVGVAAFRVE